MKVDDVLFRELKEIFARPKDGCEISAIIDRLKEESGISARDFEERLLLYGRDGEEEMVERGVGLLTAIAPGVVMLDTTNLGTVDNGYLLPLSGLLERAEPNQTQLFILRPFSPPNFSASLYIWPSTFPEEERRKRFRICPAWIQWEIGAGQCGRYDSLGIDPGRWEILNGWLEKWLPKQ